MKLGILSLLMISMLLIGLTMSVFMGFIGNAYTNYQSNIVGSYNESQFEGFNKAAKISDVLTNAQNESGFSKDNTDQSFKDIIGSLFNSGKNALNAGFKSNDAFNEMITSAQQMDTPNNAVLSPFYDTAKLIMLIILVFGLIIAIFLKWNV